MPIYQPSVKNDGRGGLLQGSTAEWGLPGLMRRVSTLLVDYSGHIALPTDYDILVNALKTNQIPQPGTANPEDGRCLLSRAIAEPMGHRKARVTLIWERVPEVTYQDDTITATIHTQNLPMTRRQILASYYTSDANWPLNSSSYGSEGAGSPIQFIRSANIAYRCPMRKLVVGKAMFGMALDDLVPDTWKNAVGNVNDRPWHGLPTGYWLCDGQRTRAIDSADDFSIALCFYVETYFFSQVKHDWSYWQFLQLPNGQFVKVADSVVDAIVAAGYDVAGAPSYKGYLHPQTKGKGLAVAYPYPAMDFAGTFGLT